MADNYRSRYFRPVQGWKKSEIRNEIRSGYSTPNHDLNSLRIYENNLDLHRARSILSEGYTNSLNSLGDLEGIDKEQELANSRKETFLDSFSNTVSIMYALALIVLGIVVYIFDLFGPNAKTEGKPVGLLGEAFDLYLCLAGIIIISFLIYDITKHLEIVKQYHNHEEAPIKLIEDENGELMISIPMNQAKPTKLPQYYLFSSKRHAGSFFFKIGATVFWLGHTIHMLIIFTREILYLQHSCNASDYAKHDCFNPIALINSILQLVYFFLQAAVIIKFSNVIVSRSKRLARMCFMHCLASSLCLWIRAITNETEDSVVKYLLDEDSKDCKYFSKLFVIPYKSFYDEITLVDGCARYIDGCNTSGFDLNMDCIYHKMCHCLNSSMLVQEAFTFTYYFYSFTIEFSILSGK